MKGIIKQYELFYRDVSKTTKFQTYARIFHKRQESYGVNSLYIFEDLLIDLNATDGETTGWGEPFRIYSRAFCRK